MRASLRRLIQLESRVPADTQPPDPMAAAVTHLQTAILAVWRGALQPHEAIVTGHARALDYTLGDYKAALTARDGAWIDRHNGVWTDLLSEHGVSLSSPPDAVVAFIYRMLERMPPAVQGRVRAACEAGLTSSHPST